MFIIRNKCIKLIGVFMISVLSSMASAGIITTYGFLTTDDSTNFITDTNTGRLYSRLDAFDLSAADTRLSLLPGGAFDGWSIATATVADDFIYGAMGGSSTPCFSLRPFGDTCGFISNWWDGSLGDSSLGPIDLFTYIASEGNNTLDLGLVEIYHSGFVYDQGSNYTEAYIDTFTIASGNSINYLLYKDTVIANVPEPSTFTIFALSFIGLASLRFKFNLKPTKSS